MNGPQDLGGRAGFGPVLIEQDEPIFHADWEGRVLGLTLCSGVLGHWNLDESRHARECLPHTFYLSGSYYDIWLTALETLLARHGEVSAAERAQGKALAPGLRPERKLDAAAVFGVLSKGGPVDRSVTAEEGFKVGDRVKTRRGSMKGHTRLPSYAMGREGVVTGVRGFHVYPDSSARGTGEAPCWLYGVTFTGEELWGEGAEPGTEVTIDAFEPYLDHA
ncbi:MAG: nitrile hydratase subunit beta [Rhodobacteraceae bacterium]|nr:nitrile hydratase subunit beta [Paracoccaceae bacterium]